MLSVKLEVLTALIPAAEFISFTVESSIKFPSVSIPSSEISVTSPVFPGELPVNWIAFWTPLLSKASWSTTKFAV